MSNNRTELLDRLKSWPPKELEKLAAQLLVLHSPKFHGSKVIHYADGCGMKIVDQPAAATRSL